MPTSGHQDSGAGMAASLFSTTFAYHPQPEACHVLLASLMGKNGREPSGFGAEQCVHVFLVNGEAPKFVPLLLAHDRLSLPWLRHPIILGVEFLAVYRV